MGDGDALEGVDALSDAVGTGTDVGRGNKGEFVLRSVRGEWSERL